MLVAPRVVPYMCLPSVLRDMNGTEKNMKYEHQSVKLFSFILKTADPRPVKI
jgi:hypothetical protein